MNAQERKEYARKYRETHREQVRATQYAWRERNKDRYLDIKRRGQAVYNEKYPEKIKAHNYTMSHPVEKVHCEYCGSRERLEYHHPDYKRPNLVVILCKDCHNELHTKLRKLSNSKVEEE